MAIAFLRHAAGALRNKFHARGLRVDGAWFASQREARRWGELQLLERAGVITGLARQVSWPLHASTAPAGTRAVVGRYVADFVYRYCDTETQLPGALVVEDTKGVRTDLYVWKKKHFELEYGFRILET